MTSVKKKVRWVLRIENISIIPTPHKWEKDEKMMMTSVNLYYVNILSIDPNINAESD